MQITARKQWLNTSHLKYFVAALGITGALAAGVVTYNVTRDDAETQRPVHSLPAMQSESMEPMFGDEGTLNSVESATIPREANRPALREGVLTEGSSGDLMTGSRKGTGIPSAIDRNEIHAYYVAGAGEGFMAGNESADLSYLAPEVRSYAEALFLEQNWADAIEPTAGSSNAGMLDEELTQQNPGANTETPVPHRSRPANVGLTE